ncbi:MAG: DUF2339 domain-containing protein [Aestuariivirga sp.]|nr:DUF2339 domain-containing protein [Aestuariivirga sp.]
MDGFGWLFSLAGFVLAIIALNKISALDTKIAQLKLQLGQLSDQLSGAPPTPQESPKPEKKKSNWPTTAVAAAKSPEPVLAEKPISVEVVKASAQAIEPVEKKPKTPKQDMEQQLASRWFVWIGGIAIAIGGLLFVKYAYENGLISPPLQIFLGLLLGAALIFVGDTLHRKTPATAEPNYVPAALSAAGLATAFGSIYAAYALYELVQPSTAFIGLALVAFGALALSLRQGPLIAALGLLGSYVTPMMISSPDPSGWSFFPYLLIILGAGFAVLRKRNWWWLGYASIIGSALWSFLWFGGPFEGADIVPIGLFALCIGAISLFAISGRSILASSSGSLLNPMGMTDSLKVGSIGGFAASLVLAALVVKSGHSGSALMLFFIGMAGVAALSWFKQGDTAAALAAALLSFIVLMVWERAAFNEWAMDESGLWSSVLRGEAPQYLRSMLAAGAAFTALGFAGVFRKSPPITWGLLAAGSALLYLFSAWGRVDGLLSDATWALLGALAAAVLLAAVWLRRGQITANDDNFTAGILAIGSAGLLLFAGDRMLNGVWLTIGMAVLAAAYAFSAKTLAVNLLGPIAAALGSLTALRLFVSRELWNDDRTLPLGQHWPLYGYGIPIVLFYFAARWLKSSGHRKSATALEGISLGLAISLVSLELRVLIGGGLTTDEPQLLEVAAHILAWMGAAYGLMYRQQIFSSLISLWGARILLGFSCAAIILLSLAALNPIVTEDPIPGNVVFNALLLAYLAPVVLLGFIARRLDSLGWLQFRPSVGILALILAMTYVSLETKRVFQGHALVAWSLSGAESYAYSAVWLVSALALFAAGIKLGRQYIRYAGLGVMVLVVLKVFLWDMSGLEGLYQIGSFLGLGLSLVGIGWLYQRFVQKPKVMEA